MTLAYIGLGSNLGDRKATMRAALEALSKRGRVTAVSSLYETDPAGPPQPLYYNAAAALDTVLDPLSLLRYLQSVEETLGRNPKHERDAPREIDLDILLHDIWVIDEPGLIIPHPRLHERAFVLVPLAQIAPDVLHPTLQKTIRQLADEVGDAGVRPIEPRGWEQL